MELSVYEYQAGLYKVCVTPSRHCSLADPLHSDVKLKESLSRTKRIIKELAMCNEWDYFCTFTFKDNRQDYDKCLSQLTKFFENYKYRHSKDFKYLIVPEFHADKSSFHFHALIKNAYGFEIPDTILKNINGVLTEVPNTKKYIRWKHYNLGWFDCSPIKSRVRVANYILKYITKDLGDLEEFANRQLVLHSKGLNKAVKISSFSGFENWDVFKDVPKGKRFVSEFACVYDNLTQCEIDCIFDNLIGG